MAIEGVPSEMLAVQVVEVSRLCLTDAGDLELIRKSSTSLMSFTRSQHPRPSKSMNSCSRLLLPPSVTLILW